MISHEFTQGQAFPVRRGHGNLDTCSQCQMDKDKAIKSLKLIATWCSKWRIKLNAGKTQLIVFSVGFKPELIDLELFGEPIIQTQIAKLL